MAPMPLPVTTMATAPTTPTPIHTGSGPMPGPTGVVLALVSTRAMLPCVDSAVVIGRRAGRHRER
jgi:hypothetical protein